jgi:hypothetical protein
MTKAHGVSGGGIQGNKVSHVAAPKKEPVVYRASPGATSRLGSMVGQGTPYKSLQTQGGSYSNPIGPSPSVAGPGGGRVVLPHGTQSHHSTTPMQGPRRDLFK